MSPVIRGALWMSGAILSFTSMALAGRIIGLELDTFEIMLYRSMIGVVIVLTIASATGHLGDIRRQKMGLHLIRNISHFTGQNLWFYAVTVAPLAQVFALEFSAPLWAMLLSALILGEALTKARVLSGLMGFVGILIVTRPGLQEFGIPQITAALCAVGFAGSAVFTRLLTRTENITSILFWLTVMQTVFGLICAGIDGEIAIPTAGAIPYIVLIAGAGLLAHFCLTTALSLAPAAIVMPIDFLRLPLIAITGALLYSEALDPFVFIGAAVIFLANYNNIRRASR